ncbi:putative F-box protein PP2-B12 [Bienertia sinuspersici]
MSSTNITDLPEGCISHILTLTSPVDVLRSSVVSKQFLSASESDVVWIKFLPSNVDDIVSQSSSSSSTILQRLTSKKKQFLYLCSSHMFFNNDTQSFALNKWSGKKCYMLGARALDIVWGNTPQYWIWRSLPESRFPEIAGLLIVWWLLIEVRIKPTILTQNTTYGAYFVYKINVDENHGFDLTPVKTSVYEFMDEDGSEDPHPDSVPCKCFYLKDPRTTVPREELPNARDDGWMEIEMGRYYVNDCVDERVWLKMRLAEIEQLHSKMGLIVEGIELRPLD